MGWSGSTGVIGWSGSTGLVPPESPEAVSGVTTLYVCGDTVYDVTRRYLGVDTPGSAYRYSEVADAEPAGMVMDTGGGDCEGSPLDPLHDTLTMLAPFWLLEVPRIMFVSRIATSGLSPFPDTSFHDAVTLVLYIYPVLFHPAEPLYVWNAAAFSSICHTGGGSLFGVKDWVILPFEPTTIPVTLLIT